MRVTTVPAGDPEADTGLRGERHAAAMPPDSVETEALGRALHQALAGLRPEYRAAVMLRYEEGLPFEEIALVLDVPEATARSFAHRARKQLAARLSAGGWQPSRA